MPNIRYITRRDGCGQRRAAGWLIGPSNAGCECGRGYGCKCRRGRGSGCEFHGSCMGQMLHLDWQITGMFGDLIFCGMYSVVIVWM